MPDVFPKTKRRAIMQAVRGKDSSPEMTVRRLVHGLGYRYRLHVGKLPGKPDLVFPSRKKVIFVHGCFWHRHTCRKGRSMPSTRPEFWKTKLATNRARDRRNQRQLRAAGWKILVVWECRLRPDDSARLTETIRTFLDGP